MRRRPPAPTGSCWRWPSITSTGTTRRAATLQSGIDWLEQNPTGGTLRTLVVEAIAEIEGISRVQAEARMFLDPIFPSDPFAR